MLGLDHGIERGVGLIVEIVPVLVQQGILPHGLF